MVLNIFKIYFQSPRRGKIYLSLQTFQNSQIHLRALRNCILFLSCKNYKFMTQVSKNYKHTFQPFKFTIIRLPFKNFRSNIQNFRNFKTSQKPNLFLQKYSKFIPINARKFQAYQSTLIDPRNPNLTSILSKTSPIVLNRRLKFRTKMPFVKNSSKNRFATSYHVLHTLPIKTP